VTGPASEAIAYPVLDDSQQARLRRYGTTRPVTAGEVLFSPADDSYDLLVVLSGEVVVSNDSLGRSVEFARHGPGQFAGELNLLTGQRPFLTARATTEGSVLALTPAQVRDVLARETDVADILLRALIARRRRRVSGAPPDAAIEIIGTGHSGPTLALRTFLNRNTIAYHWVDVDQADQAADILASVGATRGDLPVVITPTYHFCSRTCRQIWWEDRDTLYDPTVVERLLGGEIQPPTIDGILTWMGLTPDVMGDDAYGYRWAKPYAGTRRPQDRPGRPRGGVPPEQIAPPPAGAHPVPVNAMFEDDFVTQLVVVLDTDTVEEAARKVAAQVVGRRVAPRDAGLVVRHAGAVVPGGITVAESGISALDIVTVGWAE